VPLDLAKFNSAYVDARFRIEDGELDIAAAQASLRELVADDGAADDRAWALKLIEALADPPAPPREWSALYHEAGAVAAAAYPSDGSAEEKIAAIERARREIFAIAARAAEDEAPHIQAMTRSLEHIENALRNPNWPADPPADTD
jgi:hypothetical protein